LFEYFERYDEIKSVIVNENLHYISLN